jgi:predicted ester cyclase
MKPSEIVVNFFKAIEGNDFKTAESLASNDFVVEGVGPSNLSLTDFLNVHRALNSGLPDFSFNHKIVKESGDQIDAKVRLTGTHKKDMQAPIPGLSTIKATNKQVRMPEENVYATVKNNKITKVRVQQTPGGGLPGLLKQIGVELHEPAL